MKLAAYLPIALPTIDENEFLAPMPTLHESEPTYIPTVKKDSTPFPACPLPQKNRFSTMIITPKMMQIIEIVIPKEHKMLTPKSSLVVLSSNMNAPKKRRITNAREANPIIPSFHPALD